MLLLRKGRGRRDESDNIAGIELIVWVQKRYELKRQTLKIGRQIIDRKERLFVYKVILDLRAIEEQVPLLQKGN